MILISCDPKQKVKEIRETQIVKSKTIYSFMSKKYNEYKQLNLTQIGKEIQGFWEDNKTFEESLKLSEGKTPFVFYEGPPSANGQPGIHHVMARAIKDIFCRYKTQKGFYVERKAGWDTHGLPVELGVEKNLGITKEDIGVKISVDDYNKACREEVMKYKDLWDDLTKKMGYWVDLEHPYITFDNEYIETLWFLLSELYKKGFLYKGYTIQPYSPAAGTGLSSHELNMPGCYRDVKDTTCVAMFKVRTKQPNLTMCPFNNPIDTPIPDNLYILAWTTTPWTLPSNTALAVGTKIEYLLLETYNPYSGNLIQVILAKKLLNVYFPEKNVQLPFEEYKQGDKNIPYRILSETTGERLAGMEYEQLIPFVKPEGKAFQVITGDFVTTEDGTGIVHIAPTFGSDDDRVAKQSGISPLILIDKEGKRQPMVDRSGKFFRIEDLDKDFVQKYVNVDLYKDFAGRFVKNDYDPALTEKDPTLDVDLAVMLKQQGLAFKIEKHSHNYPHCWRTDKPVLYYPLDSWFIKTTSVKDRMIELNKTINWKPEATGSGRFGNWLENLVDWNLSRSRYWGTPLPIWRTEDGTEEICIGSVAQLSEEIEKSIKAGFMDKNPYKGDYKSFDLHRPYIDGVVLVSSKGNKMHRELDLIDVWFDSGAMPYAQLAPLNPPQGGKSGKPNYQTATPSSYRLLKELVEKNRKNPTQSEEVLWEMLRGKKLEGYKFRRQHLVEEFIVDFVCLSKHLIVEIDGGYHNMPEVKEADEWRTKQLNRLGYKVIRFTNEEVLCDTDNVLKKIQLTLDQTPLWDLAKKVFPAENNSQDENLPPWGGLRGAGVFPADFIAEGVDQTRGWFFTLHAIAAMLFDSVAFKNVVSNGLVLDKNGNKMSKRLGNAVDPFQTIEKYGPDATRWYMITNSQPWDNLKFDIEGVDEVRRKFFGTLYNTYSFFALYANIDGFAYAEKDIEIAKRPEIDRWILSELNTLIKDVDSHYNDYEPTKAGRAIQDFVDEYLSNWYVRLCRRRFWKGEYSEDKISAYQTLYACLEVLARLSAPIAPFFAERLFCDLNAVTQRFNVQSVHHTDFPVADEDLIDKDLEERMQLAQKISSMALSLRKKTNIRVRQPLAKIMIPVNGKHLQNQIEAVKDLILSEVNVKNIEFLSADNNILVKKIKANFKTLGPKYGKIMKGIAAALEGFTQEQITKIEQKGIYSLQVESETAELTLNDVEIITQDIPGWVVANEGTLTVALDISITQDLKDEGIARELVNRIQNIRKESNYDVMDKIKVDLQQHAETDAAVTKYKDYICSETLTEQLYLVPSVISSEKQSIEIIDGLVLDVWVRK